MRFSKASSIITVALVAGRVFVSGQAVENLELLGASSLISADASISSALPSVSVNNFETFITTTPSIAATQSTNATSLHAASIVRTTVAPSSSFATAAVRNASSTTSAKAPTTVSLFNACGGSGRDCISLEQLTFYGSVVTADRTKTVYALGCSRANVNATQDCFSKPIVVTQGPGMFEHIESYGSVPKTVSCEVQTSPASAKCTELGRPAATGTISAGYPRSTANATLPGLSFDFGSNEIHYNTLVITEGAEKLSGNATTSTALRTPSAPSSPIGATPVSQENGAVILSAPFAALTALLFALLAF